VWLSGSAATVCPPQASDDTGTALGQDWSHDLATLIFNLGGHGAFCWCGSSSIRIPSLKFLRLAIRKIWWTMCVIINGPGMMLTFDLGGSGGCGWCGSSSSIHIPTFKFVGLAIRKIWPGDLDRSTLKLVCESHQRWGTFIPNLGTLDLRVFQLFAMLTEGRTDKSNV